MESRARSSAQQEVFASLTPRGAAERRMERLLAEEQHRHLQLQEQLAQQLAQSLGNTLSSRLDKVLRDEMKRTVPQSQYRRRCCRCCCSFFSSGDVPF